MRRVHDIDDALRAIAVAAELVSHELHEIDEVLLALAASTAPEEAGKR